jgi:hypothetical protein
MQVWYVGDGGNDLCPAHSLRARDKLFVREGYKLDQLLAGGQPAGSGGGHREVAAAVVRWREAGTILAHLQQRGSQGPGQSADAS